MKSKVEDLRSRVEKILIVSFYEKVIVRTAGSWASSMCLRGSDLDLVLDTDYFGNVHKNKQQRMKDEILMNKISKLQEVIKQHFSDVVCVIEARVPLVKFFDHDM